MRIAVVGAGAIGSTLAARLSEHGHRVTLIGRADHVAAIRCDGLLVVQPNHTARRYRLEAATQLSERPDLVLLTVKTQDVPQACADLLPVAAGVPVVALQNGVRGDQLAAAALGRHAAAGGVVMCAATYLRPGVVSVQFPGWLIVGEPYSAVGARTSSIAAALAAAVPTYITRHLERVRWSKLLSNLNNALGAATGLTLAEVTRTPTGRVLAVRLMKEGWRVARATGVRLDHGLYGLTPRALGQRPAAAGVALLQSMMTPALATLPERAALAVVGAASRSALGRLPIRGSTWQSIARGKATEIDYLNGEIVRRGWQHGILTPYNARAVACVRAVERTRTYCSVAALIPDGPHAAALARVGSL